MYSQYILPHHQWEKARHAGIDICSHLSFHEAAVSSVTYQINCQQEDLLNALL